MDFNSKKFWVAQSLVGIMTVLLFMGNLPLNDWLIKVMEVEVAWGVLDVAGKFLVAKKNGGT